MVSFSGGMHVCPNQKSGNNRYLQIVENRWERNKSVQRVIATLGRIDQMQAKGEIDNLVRSLSRFSETIILILSARDNPLVQATAKKIGPAIIFERIWEELGIGKIIRNLLKDRKFEFDVERAVFLTVLHRLFVSGSDRYCDKWRRDQRVDGVEDLSLHHLYRAMAFLGEESRIRKTEPPLRHAVPKICWKKKSFMPIAISSPAWISSSSIPPRSTSREMAVRPWEKKAIARTIVPIWIS